MKLTVYCAHCGHEVEPDRLLLSLTPAELLDRVVLTDDGAPS